MLIVLAGLPGTGKSTIGSGVARTLGCALISVDRIDAALRLAGIDPDQPTGLAAYVAAEAVAAEQLRLGHHVVVDAVNDASPARQQWRDLAQRTDAQLLFAEVLIADESEHRRRLENRRRDLGDFPEPTWAEVQRRRSGFDGWSEPHLRVDASDPVDANVRRVVDAATAAP